MTAVETRIFSGLRFADADGASLLNITRARHNVNQAAAVELMAAVNTLTGREPQTVTLTTQTLLSQGE